MFLMSGTNFIVNSTVISVVLMPIQVSSSMKNSFGANSFLSLYHAGPSR